MRQTRFGLFVHYQYRILMGYCGNVYHGQGNANQFSDQELIDWINTCNRQGGVCTLDSPFDPRTGLLKDFGLAQLKRVAHAVKGDKP